MNVRQGNSQEDVLRNRSCASGDNEGGRDGDIDGPVLNSCDRRRVKVYHGVYTVSVV